MHYYQHNIGDYRRDTVHLSLLEHGVYRQLIDLYYLDESPLTSDLNQLCRKLCARSQEEKDSVEIILNEFFQLTESGWMHKRCDEEIEAYMIQDEDNRARIDNEKERNRRHREERKKLFSDLREVGQIPKWDLHIDQLRALHKQYCNVDSTDLQRTCNAPATQQVNICNEPDTAITNNAITTNQEPRTINHKPTYVDSGSNEPSSTNLSGVVAKKSDITPVKKPEEPITRQTWKAYAEAYFIRYGADPVRNATVTGQLAQFVKRIGQDESPHVASFFVHHNNQFYVQKMHTVGLLLADAEKLRTEWATKRTVTNTQARQIDRKQNTVEVFKQLIDEQRAAKNARN